jgi:putative exosortase-associated protein (TIGR04073 family)
LPPGYSCLGGISASQPLPGKPANFLFDLPGCGDFETANNNHLGCRHSFSAHKRNSRRRTGVCLPARRESHVLSPAAHPAFNPFAEFSSKQILPHAAMAKSEPDYLDKKGGKLENGIANAVGGFIEIPKTVMIMSRSDGPVYDMTVGLLAGIVYMLGRTVYGAVDMATFMIPTKPLVDPDYIWNDFDRITTYKPNVQMQ